MRWNAPRTAPKITPLCNYRSIVNESSTMTSPNHCAFSLFLWLVTHLSQVAERVLYWRVSSHVQTRSWEHVINNPKEETGCSHVLHALDSHSTLQATATSFTRITFPKDMSRPTTSQIIEKGDYLKPDFEPSSLTIPHLIGIFAYHQISYPSPHICLPAHWPIRAFFSTEKMMKKRPKLVNILTVFLWSESSALILSFAFDSRE